MAALDCPGEDRCRSAGQQLQTAPADRCLDAISGSIGRPSRPDPDAVLGLPATPCDATAGSQSTRGPSYEQGLTPGSVLPALAACSLDDSEIPDLRRIIQVFTDAQVKGGGVAYVRQQLEHMPEVSADDRAKLLDGARQDLDTTLRHLVDHNCRILLQAHFDEGGSRAWLLHMIDIGRGSEDR